MEKLNSLLITILESIVSVPSEIQLHEEVQEDEHGKFNQITVTVAKEDVGLCIGKGGKTAEAIRVITGIAGFKESGERFHVRVDAPKFSR